MQVALDNFLSAMVCVKYSETVFSSLQAEERAQEEKRHVENEYERARQEALERIKKEEEKRKQEEKKRAEDLRKQMEELKLQEQEVSRYCLLLGEQISE